LAGCEEAWCMVTGLKEMAFMQPPGDDWNMKDPWSMPDQSDVLITSRNHDVKRHIIHNPTQEHWVFALVSIQTTWGYGGPFNYGVLRVRNSYSARCFLSILPSTLSLGARFLREVQVWSEEIRACQDSGKQGKNHKLLWTHYWSGVEQIDSMDLHPAAVEVCRMYKLIEQNGKIICVRKGSKKSRVAQTGPWVDVWTPMRVEEDGTVSRVSLSGSPDLRNIHKILFEYTPCRSMIPRERDGDSPILQVRGVARDPSRNGMTAGYVDLHLPMPFKRESERAQMGERAMAWILTLESIREQLRTCIFAFLQGGPEQIDKKHEGSTKQSANYLSEFDQTSLRDFFACLMETNGVSLEKSNKLWQQKLFENFSSVIGRVTDSAPVPSSVRYRAIARCENLAQWTVRNMFPLIWTKEE